MNKKEVQQRVLQNGKPLALNKFTWDEKTRTFSSSEDGLVLDFKGETYCTFKTGSDCTFNTWSRCTFNTWSRCTFNTRYDCTFDTWSDCTFKTGSDCVVIRRDVYQVIELKGNVKYQLFPYEKKGYLEDGMYNGKPHIIIDGIVSEVLSHKGNIYKVKNLGEEEVSYIVQDGDIYSHGDTLKQAKDSLIYKISNRDTTKYESMKLDTVLTKREAIEMYRCITGACETGTRYFVEHLSEVKSEYTIKEIIDLTKGQYNWELLNKFFKEK